MAVAKTVEKTKLIVRVEAGEGTYKNMTFNSIKESATEFAKRLGISKTSLSLRLNNQIHFSQRDIYRSMRILQISPEELGVYFFDKEKDPEYWF